MRYATRSIVTGIDAVLTELRGMGITVQCYLALGCPTASALVLPQHKYSKTTTSKTLYCVIICMPSLLHVCRMQQQAVAQHVTMYGFKSVRKGASRDWTSCDAPSYNKLYVYEGVLTYCCAHCRQSDRLLALG
jgi:hypothetical protein